MHHHLPTGERLSDAEALMWRLGLHDARLRPVITAVAVLERSPGIDAVAARAEALVSAAPRFGARVVPAVTPAAPPRLVVDEQFDLAAHVRVVAAPGQGTFDDVLAMAGPLAGDGPDLARPLWQLTLVEGMVGGRAALVIRVHHALTDGMGAVALAGVLFGDAPVEPVTPLGVPVGGVAASLERLVDDLVTESSLAVGALRRGVPLAAGLVRKALGAPAAAREGAGVTLDTVRSMVSAAGLDGRPRSPLMVGRSASIVFGTLDVELEALRRRGRAVGGTINDVVVTAVVEGLRRYHAKHGSRPAALRVAVPVDVRDGDASGALGGNAFFPARVDIGLTHADVDEALAAVHDAVAGARSEPVLDQMHHLAAVVGRIPGAEALVARALGSIDVITSNVVGSPTRLSLGGVEVSQLVAFGPRSGAGANVTVISYAGTLHVGVNLDPAATPDTDVVLDCLAGAFADVVETP